MMKKLCILLFAFVASATLVQAEVYSGYCGAEGDNLTWSLNTEDSILVISGTGAMEDYCSAQSGGDPIDPGDAFVAPKRSQLKRDIVTPCGYTPWESYTSYIKHVQISLGVTYIGDNAFYDFPELVSIIFKTIVPPTTGYSFVKGSCSFIVPCGTKTAYVATLGVAESSVFEDTDNCDPQPCILAMGTCGAQGENLNWELSCDSILTISGTGAMANYSFNAPWYELREYISHIIIAEGVTTIGKYAFTGSSNLSLVSIPNSILSIGELAFHNCPGLLTVSIPNSVTSIEGGAFGYCTALTAFEVDAASPNYCAAGGILFNKNQTKLVAYPAGLTVSSYSIPTTVTHIEAWAFNSAKLTAITIPNSVVSIGSHAFSDSKGLVSISLPENLTKIEDWTFCGSGITSITIPNSVTRIGGWAFKECNNLQSIEIPNSVTYIDRDAFDLCRNLTSVTLSNNLTRIEQYTFSGCDKLASVTIPNSVTRIELWAFYDCNSLQSITIPDMVTYIGSYAFSGCRNLTEISCRANTPPTLSTSVFQYVDKAIPVYVPYNSVAAYQSANGWSAFTNILPITNWNPGHPNNPGNYRLTLEVADTLQGYTIGSGLYEQGATVRIEAVAKDGYEFVKWSDNDSAAVRNIVLSRDCTLIAGFTNRYYWVQFVNYDGEILLETEKVYGAIPEYIGMTPVRPASADYEYIFAGWNPQIGPVTHDTIYTALFDSVFLGDEYVHVWGNQDITELPVGKRSHIIVYGNGELHISRPTTVKALTIRKDTTCGEVFNIDLLTADSIDLVQTFIPSTGDISSRWFAFGVPFAVSVANGISKADANSPALYGSDYVIDEYDGVLRADTQDGWKRVSSTATLYPGKLYMLSSREASSWRFTAAYRAYVSWFATVQAYPSALGDHHAGWNGIANPLMFKTNAYSSDIPYATVFNNQYGVYQVVQMNDSYVWNIGDPFFVQSSHHDTVYFAAPSTGAISSGPIGPGDVIGDAPGRRTASDTAIPTVIKLANANYTDKAYVNTVPDKQNSYTIGMDLEKLQVSNPSVPQVWIEAYGTHLAAYAITPELLNAPLTLGLYAPYDGTYTFSISNLPSDVTVRLTQNGTSVSDLTYQSCEIPLQAGISTGYALTVSKAPTIGTGLEEALDALIPTRKLLRDGHIFILRGDRTYTLTGQEVK